MSRINRFEETRAITRRIEINAVLTLTTAAHLGGSESLSLSDQPILKGHDGLPYIPGTTLAGLLRTHLHEKLGGGAQEHEQVADLLGCRWSEENEPQSALIVDDALLMGDRNFDIELRDGVKIDGLEGIAQKHMKFDMELLPTGTRFEIKFELLLEGNDAKDQIRMENLLWLFQQFEEGNICLGGRTRRGFGRCRASQWAYRDFDLNTIDGLFQWIGRQGGGPDEWPEAPLLPVTARRHNYKITDLASDWDITLTVPGVVFRRLKVNLTMTPAGNLLIRSGGHLAGEADAVHLHRINSATGNLEPIISGTSLAGVLRHRASKILNSLSRKSEPSKVREFMDVLFGPDMSQEDHPDPRASKLRTEEAVIYDATLLRHTRTTIDRWRGSALNSALIQEDVLFGGSVILGWEIEEPSDSEIGLCLCLVKDLFTGDLPIGGESSIGRGVLYGIGGTISIPQTMHPSSTISLTGDGKGQIMVQGDVSRYFEALKQDFLKEDPTHAA